MNETMSTLFAKSKAFDVIESCETGDHFAAAEKYIELYHQKYDDFYGYHELKRELQRVRVESLNPRG
jgi:hypothetical protein